jgi:hypothetical protein
LKSARMGVAIRMRFETGVMSIDVKAMVLLVVWWKSGVVVL